MISRQQAESFAEEENFFAAVRENCLIHPEQVRPICSNPCLQLNRADPKWMKVILYNSPGLQLFDLKRSHNLGNQHILCLSGVKSTKTLDDVREFFSGLKVLSYWWAETECGSAEEARLDQIVDVVNDSQYRGRVKIEYLGSMTQTHFETLFKLTNPLSLVLNEIQISRSMTQLLGRLHPVLQEIHLGIVMVILEYVRFEDPQLFVEVLNTLQKLESLSIHGQNSLLNLALLRSGIKTLELSYITLSPDCFATILMNNPLLQNLRLLDCKIKNEHLALLPDKREIKMRVLDFGHYMFNPNITFLGIKSIVHSCPDLLELALYGHNKIGNKALALICTLHFLQKINLGMCGLSNLGLIHLKKLKNLHEIKSLVGNTISLGVFLQIFKNTKGLKCNDNQYLHSVQLRDETSAKRKHENLLNALGIRSQ